MNSKCYYTYIFDTYTDISLYEGQWVSALYILLQQATIRSPSGCTDIGRAHGLDCRVQPEQLAAPFLSVGARCPIPEPILDADTDVSATRT